MLVTGGKSNHLHLWCLESKQLLRIIQMPTKVRAVRHLEFFPDSFDGGSNQVSYVGSLRMKSFGYLNEITFFLRFAFLILYYIQESYFIKYLLCCCFNMFLFQILYFIFFSILY